MKNRGTYLYVCARSVRTESMGTGRVRTRKRHCVHVRRRSVGMLKVSYVEFMNWTHHLQDPIEMSMSSVSFSHESTAGFDVSPVPRRVPHQACILISRKRNSSIPSRPGHHEKRFNVTKRQNHNVQISFNACFLTLPVKVFGVGN